MYDTVLKDGEWWITCNGVILEELGSFCEPISPRVIIEEIKDEV